jgi:transposase
MKPDDLTALATASRTELLALIVRQQAFIADQQATIERLEAAVAEVEARLRALEGRGGPGAPAGMPGHKPAPRTPTPPPKPRQRRARGYARRRAAPTAVVTHAVAACPTCAVPLAGGWVAHTRQVVELPLAPAQITEHQFLQRRCPCCRRAWTPAPRQALAGVVVDRQRFGVNLLSLIVTLREAGRLPVEAVQWYLRTVHGLAVSTGAIVAAQRTIAGRGRAEVAAIRAQVRASPVVHADETGWRENGRNGYLWTFSTPTAQYFVHGSRARAVVTEALGEPFGGTLVTDFYAAYNHHEGPHQRCWAHLLRDIEALTAQHPDDGPVQRWARRVTLLFRQAKRFADPDERTRLRARLRFEQELRRLCRPFLERPDAAAGTLCRRIEKFLKQLFVFVADPSVPPTNNLAERSVRHQVTIRKISGGTRSAEGTATKTALATLFGTWRVQGRDPLAQCRQLLTAQP